VRTTGTKGLSFLCVMEVSLTVPFPKRQCRNVKSQQSISDSRLDDSLLPLVFSSLVGCRRNTRGKFANRAELPREERGRAVARSGFGLEIVDEFISNSWPVGLGGSKITLGGSTGER
jgi:hypothetical protein